MSSHRAAWLLAISAFVATLLPGPHTKAQSIIPGTSSGSSTPCTTTALSLQYNNAGAFGCVSGVTSNGTLMTFAPSDLVLGGSSTGTTAITSANAGASNFTITAPAVTDTLAVLGTAQTWTAAQTYNNSDIKLLGSSTGATTLTSANAGASNFTITLPAVTDTLAVLATAQTFTAAQTYSVNGALSTPAGSYTGTWITGGSSTTTTPQLLIQPTGTTSNNWSTSGTGIGVNAGTCSSSCNLIDLQTTAIDEFHVSGSGIMFTAGSVVMAAGSGGNTVTMIGSRLVMAAPASNSWELGGGDVASPTAQILGFQNATGGTNNAGANATIRGSLSTGTGLGGSVIISTSLKTAGSGVQNTAQTALTADGNQHVYTSSSGLPTITNGTASANSTDEAGIITVGTTITTLTIAFKIAYTNTPACVLADTTNMARLLSYTVSNSQIVATMTSNTGDIVHYVCSGLGG